MFKADADRSGEQTADLQQNLLDRGSAFARSKSAEQRLDRIEAPANVPVTPIKRPDTNQPGTGRGFLASGRQRVRWGLFALLPIAMIAGAGWYVTGGRRDVDRRRLCRRRQGRHFNRRFRYRPGRRCPRQPARDCRTDSLPARTSSIPDRTRQRESKSRRDRAVDRCDEARLQAHAKRRCGRAGAARSRPDQLQSPKHAAAFRHGVTGHVRSGALHAARRQEQT